jgi:hypothetical protein
LVVPVEQFFESYESFNTDFIKQQNIKSIKLIHSEKLDGEIIISKPAIKRFHFDLNGIPTKEVYIESRGIYTDSSTIHFSFNPKSNLLEEELISYQGETIKRTFEYSPKNRIQTITTTQKVGMVSDTTASEQYREPYSDDSFTKRIYLNSEGRPYLEERNYFENKRLVRQEKDLIITAKSASKEWKYNGGLLEQIEYSNSINANEKGVYSFEYFDKDYLEYVYHFIHDQLSEKIAFVYSSDKATHLEAIVIRHEQKGKIEIIQLEYSYY